MEERSLFKRVMDSDISFIEGLLKKIPAVEVRAKEENENTIACSEILTAAATGNVELITQYLERKDRRLFDERDGFSAETAMHIAARFNQVSVLRLLKKHRVELKIDYRASRGRDPLHSAAANGHVDAIKALLEGTDPCDGMTDTKDFTGNTPLHEAIIHGHEGVVEALCQHGASLYITNEQDSAIFAKGKTPIELAIQYHPNLLLVLIKYAKTEKERIELTHLAFYHACSNENLRFVFNPFVKTQFEDVMNEEGLPRADFVLARIFNKKVESQNSLLDEQGRLDRRIVTTLFSEEDKEAVLRLIDDNDNINIDQLRAILKEEIPNILLNIIVDEKGFLKVGYLKNLLEPSEDLTLGTICEHDTIQPEFKKILLALYSLKKCYDLANVDCDYVFEDGSLIQRAVLSNNAVAVESLCRLGAKIDEMDEKGNTLLHQGIQINCDKAVLALIEQKADQTIANDKGDLPLHRAAHLGSLVLVIALHQPDSLEVLNEKGETPLFVAVKASHYQVLPYLWNGKIEALNMQNEDQEFSLYKLLYKCKESINDPLNLSKDEKKDLIDVERTVEFMTTHHAKVGDPYGDSNDKDEDEQKSVLSIVKNYATIFNCYIGPNRQCRIYQLILAEDERQQRLSMVEIEKLLLSQISQMAAANSESAQVVLEPAPPLFTVEQHPPAQPKLITHSQHPAIEVLMLKLIHHYKVNTKLWQLLFEGKQVSAFEQVTLFAKPAGTKGQVIEARKELQANADFLSLCQCLQEKTPEEQYLCIATLNELYPEDALLVFAKCLNLNAELLGYILALNQLTDEDAFPPKETFTNAKGENVLILMAKAPDFSRFECVLNRHIRRLEFLPLITQRSKKDETVVHILFYYNNLRMLEFFLDAGIIDLTNGLRVGGRYKSQPKDQNVFNCHATSLGNKLFQLIQFFKGELPNAKFSRSLMRGSKVPVNMMRMLDCAVKLYGTEEAAELASQPDADGLTLYMKAIMYCDPAYIEACGKIFASSPKHAEKAFTNILHKTQVNAVHVVGAFGSLACATQVFRMNEGLQIACEQPNSHFLAHSSLDTVCLTHCETEEDKIEFIDVSAMIAKRLGNHLHKYIDQKSDQAQSLYESMQQNPNVIKSLNLDGAIRTIYDSRELEKQKYQDEIQRQHLEIEKQNSRDQVLEDIKQQKLREQEEKRLEALEAERLVESERQRQLALEQEQQMLAEQAAADEQEKHDTGGMVLL